jgi:hypothetical protein
MAWLWCLALHLRLTLVKEANSAMINQEPLITSDKDGMALVLISTCATDLGKRCQFNYDKPGTINYKRQGWHGFDA